MSDRIRTRTKLDTGIYRDQWGIAATVKVGKLQREKRFDAETSIKTIKAWQDETRVALRKIAPTAERGTFAKDAERYLRAVASVPTFKEREKHIALWTAEFGARARYTIGTADVDAVLSRWLNRGLSASTVRNRRTALLHLWNRLDGADAPNPVRRSLKPALADPEARAITYAQINAILQAMPDVGQGLAGKARDDASKTKARSGRQRVYRAPTQPRKASDGRFGGLANRDDARAVQQDDGPLHDRGRGTAVALGRGGVQPGRQSAEMAGSRGWQSVRRAEQETRNGLEYNKLGRTRP